MSYLGLSKSQSVMKVVLLLSSYAGMQLNAIN